ncbi:hypothetical protein [Paenibacillus polymyxa]|uniref:Uncharacterized protein n=1 Tax=Paenibacillus polymyxa (strain SC2) TaxID=886882 RepID=E3E8R3_PAEPS|nr:hypothetical protein [Paenibacillus polymyxa]ADO57772.1 hypothetical protein PPSC2_17855 [Paenibacillus polymyxa SC2]WPQ55511.1 hypothetical protein SKN87_18170 [Paenibacillus polymyxa]CCI70404.1 hypothetical protein PPM_3595 [Paenibacillus polymyxa M1]
METNYKKLLDQMMAPYDEMLQSLISDHADYSKVDYLEKYSEEYGKNDANYTNRLKVLLAMYNREDRYAPYYEPIVRRLLVNEIIDRETNSFQGIGDALYYAVFLLQKYEREQDQVLFQQAKKANFDTYAGFDPELILETYLFSKDTADLEDCINIASELGEDVYLSLFIDLWIREQTDWDKENLRTLVYHERWRNHAEGEIEALKKLAEMEKIEENSSNYCSTASSLAEKLIETGRWDEAWETMATIIPLITKEKEWFLYGLGRNIITACIHIIMHFGAKSRQATSLWQMIKGVLQPATNNMGTIQYQLAVSVSKFMGDTKLEQKLLRIRKQRQ